MANRPLVLDGPGIMAGHIYDSCQLPDASTHIRLLHIHPTQDDGAVECTMSAHLLAEVPPFNAISYTWGEEGAIDQIIVNGQRVPVTGCSSSTGVPSGS